MASVSFKPHRPELLAAYQDVIEEQSSTDWALYTYEDGTDTLTLASSGGGGLPGLTTHFENQKVMYGFCSVKEPHAMLARYVLINWVGEDVPDARKCACASHVAEIADFFQGVDVIVNASSIEDIDPLAIGQRLSNGTGRLASPVLQRLQVREEGGGGEPVGTNYQKTDAAVEMKRLNREQFWEQAKREEEERKQQEKQKAIEDRLRFEQERMEQERKEQEEREKRYREREQEIEEHRKKILDEEEEESKKRLQSNSIFNCLFIPCQVTQSNDDEAAEAKRTESEVEEAAAIIAQRTENPREFFRQQERATSETSPTLLTPRAAVRSSSEAGPPRSSDTERHSSLGEEWNKAFGSEQPMQENAWNPQGLTEDVFMETRDEDGGFPAAPQLTGTEESGMDMGEVDLMSDSHIPPAQDSSNLLDLWQNEEPQGTTWADGNLMTSHSEIKVEQKVHEEQEVSPAVPEDNLLNFEELPQPPATFCDMEAEEDPQSIIHIEGPHQMTLSYQHALQEASCHQPELADSLLTNGETPQIEGTQASEGYFSQSQDEDFAQSEDMSAKAPPPVFYNKPPEIDITCWDSDPVMEEEEDDEEGGGLAESA
uniref:Drebrin n=1 Tax=Leptobrachium leishanense TaxID=445787 RepID=A0A8C5M1U0_9ANUR